MSRKEIIISTVKDLVGDFLYYGRKEDEDLEIGEIENAIIKNEISIDEIIKTFESELREKLS